MEDYKSRLNTPKRTSSSNLQKKDSRAEQQRAELQQLSKLVSKKGKQDEKSFTFSLSQFEQKNRSSKQSKETKDSQSNIILQDTTNLRQSNDSDKQSRRKMIYGSESYKQKYEQQFPTSVETNNDLFSMVFLNKTKANETPSQVFIKQKNGISIKEGQIENSGVSITDFNLGKKLGSGKFGEVFIARHKLTGFMCAIKKIKKQNVDSKLIVQLVRQIKIQSFLNNPNIVKMYTFFSDRSFIYLALELCYSGQLYTFLKKKRKIGEDMTKNIVQQICRALDYMHENEIIHRDLKPQNIIYHAGLLKICDFGWSISTNTMRGTFCGTPLYVSPELLKRKSYNNKIDVWSIGILTYQLLFGRVPFQITTENDFRKIVQDEIKFSKTIKISDEAKDFILICLQKDPRDRFTLPELLEHAFLTKLQNVSLAEMY